MIVFAKVLVGIPDMGVRAVCVGIDPNDAKIAVVALYC